MSVFAPRFCNYCEKRLDDLLYPTLLWNGASYIFCCVGHKLAFRRKLLRLLQGRPP